MKEMCQCPEWGDLHFYYSIAKFMSSLCGGCVNALNGATFISTYPSLKEILP